jgi:DNA-binding MarR family transcriptional regulator
MNRDAAAYSVLRDYPRIYRACHVRHPPKRKSRGGITGHDADLLVLIAVGGLRSSELAEHLGLARSTVSEAVTRLRRLGLVVSRDCATDRRAKALEITASGKSAIAMRSVLDVQLVRGVLKGLTAVQCQRAVEGLRLLADAASRSHA